MQRITSGYRDCNWPWPERDLRCNEVGVARPTSHGLQRRAQESGTCARRDMFLVTMGAIFRAVSQTLSAPDAGGLQRTRQGQWTAGDPRPAQGQVVGLQNPLGIRGFWFRDVRGVDALVACARKAELRCRCAGPLPAGRNLETGRRKHLQVLSDGHRASPLKTQWF